MYKIGFTSEEIGREKLEILKELGWNYEIIPNPREKISELAKNLMGKPYRRGASVSKDAPNEFDCSSFSSYLYAQAGIAIPRISVDQYTFADAVLMEEARLGDLVFINTNRGVIYYETIEYEKGAQVPEGVDHVGVYLGNGEMIHTSSRTGEVVVEKISEIESLGEKVVGVRCVPGVDEERIAIEIPEDRKELRNKEALLNFLNENYLIAAE